MARSETTRQQRAAKTRRPSGAQYRKKAKIRRTTHPLVQKVLNFATLGMWRLQVGERWVWVRAFDTPKPTSIAFNPTVAAVHRDLVACLERIPLVRKGRAAGGLLIEGAFRSSGRASAADVARQGGDSTSLQILHAVQECSWVIEHLQTDQRWRDVYRCVECERWFLALHDPRNPKSPFCGPSCWPSTTSRDKLAPPRRVKSSKTRTPKRGV